MDNTFEKEFQFANKIITEASQITLSYFEKNPKSRLKADKSIVTEADEHVETFIRQKASSTFPSYGFIGEETDEDKKDITWIVDPIDGTSSFTRGITNFATVIALLIEEQIVFSLIHLPVANVLFTAQKDKGAEKNGKSIQVSLIENMDNALISIDRRAPQVDYSMDYIDNFIKSYQVRIGDHAGVGSGYVAQGSIDLFIKFYQKIWDTAPESLLIQEAGGIVTDEFGDVLKLTYSKESKTNYIATNSILHKNYNDLLYYPKS